MKLTWYQYISKRSPVLWAIPSLALAGYWSTLDNSFGLDDFAFVGRLAQGENILSISSLLDDLKFVRIIGLFLFYLDFWIYGIWAPGYHITNLLIHILNGFILLAVIRRLWPSFANLAAYFFIIAPFTIEGVAWISARFDLLMTTWFLLGVLALLRDRAWLGAGAFGLALLTKEPAVTALPVALTIALSRRNLQSNRLKLALPTIGLVVLYLIFRIWLYGGIGGYTVGRSELFPNIYRWLPINARNLFYLFGSPISYKISGVLPSTYLLGFLWLIPWLGLLRPQAWRVPLAVGLAFFLLTYSPTAFVPLSTHGVTWRFLYLPSAGLALGAAWVVSQTPWRKVIAILTIAAWLLVLNVNLVFWETSSFHIERLITEIKDREPQQGNLLIVVPASFAGAYITPYSAELMGVLYRPGIKVTGLTEKEARSISTNLLPSLIAPRPLLCFPSFGKQYYSSKTLPSYYQHPSWKYDSPLECKPTNR